MSLQSPLVTIFVFPPLHHWNNTRLVSCVSLVCLLYVTDNIELDSDLSLRQPWHGATRFLSCLACPTSSFFARGVPLFVWILYGKIRKFPPLSPRITSPLVSPTLSKGPPIFGCAEVSNLLPCRTKPRKTRSEPELAQNNSRPISSRKNTSGYFGI